MLPQYLSSNNQFHHNMHVNAIFRNSMLNQVWVIWYSSMGIVIQNSYAIESSRAERLLPLVTESLSEST